MPTPDSYTLSLHDALPISQVEVLDLLGRVVLRVGDRGRVQQLDQLRRSEEHTSELQSPCNLVCRLLLEKKSWALPEACAAASRGCTWHAGNAHPAEPAR